MRTITCRQLGGPCDLEHHGTTADEVIKAQDGHLKKAVAAGDAVHEPARAEMKGRWRHPRRSMSWYRAAQRTFSELPESR